MSNWRCPCCGGTELLEGYQHTDGKMMPGKVTLGIAGSRIRHVFCKQCGTIVYSQVTDTRGFSPYRPTG